ncbi:MAG: hypothetical protein GY859_11765 [Desulfobacterales bacterium]|nr:hypothetical protein [Desulfobacterales bacterium]
MNKLVAILALAVFACLWASPALSHNPFTSRPENQHAAPAPPIKSKFFVKLILWQHQLKQKMSALIREARGSGNIKPLVFLIALAFAYGAVHAAGPGHGKFVAMSFILSRKASIIGGLLFGVFIAGIHGLSGVVGVLGLRYVIQRSVGDTLETVTAATQITSFSLILLLGLGVLIKSAWALFAKNSSRSNADHSKETPRSWLPWAAAVGLVPCPAVVMVTLFCLSMDALALGLLMAAFMSIGMAATISFVVLTVILGKKISLRAVPTKRIETVEGVMGVASGLAVTVFGALFLTTALL